MGGGEQGRGGSGERGIRGRQEKRYALVVVVESVYAVPSVCESATVPVVPEKSPPADCDWVVHWGSPESPSAKQVQQGHARRTFDGDVDLVVRDANASGPVRKLLKHQ